MQEDKKNTIQSQNNINNNTYINTQQLQNQSKISSRPQSRLSQNQRPASKKSIKQSPSRIIQKHFDKFQLKIILKDQILTIQNKSKQTGQIYQGVYKFDDINQLTRVFFDSMDDLFNQLTTFYKDYLQVLEDGSIKFNYTFNGKSRIVPFSLIPKQMDKYQQLLQVNSLLRRQIQQIKSKIPQQKVSNEELKKELLQMINQLRQQFEKSQQVQDMKINSNQKKIFDNQTQIRQILKTQHQNQQTPVTPQQAQRQKQSHQKIMAMQKKRQNQLLQLKDRHQEQIVSLKGKLDQINLHLKKANEILQSTASKVQMQQSKNNQLRQKQQQVRNQLDQQIDNNYQSFQLVSQKIGIPYLGFKKVHVQVDTQTQTFKKCYQYSKATKRVTSKGYGCYYSIVGKQPLPRSGRYYFQIYVPKNLHQNALHVGIVTEQDRLKQKALSSSQSIYLNNFDRRVVQTGETNVYASQHVTGGTLVTVMVDHQNKKIGWHFKQKTQAVKELKELYLKNKIYPVFALYHQNTDCIQMR